MKYFALAFALIPAAWCQKPAITSVNNGASYQITTDADGELATIFGTNLAASVATASGFPLPRQLAGTTVTRNGVAAPLLYVSPTQINFQMPSSGDNVPGVGNAPGIVVTTAAGSSDPFAETGWQAVGILTVDGSGCGQGAVLNVDADGSYSPNSRTNSASPGEWILIFGTGLYPVTVQPPDGVPTPPNAIVQGTYDASVLFDTVVAANVSWDGLAPGYVGLDQFNVQIPADARQGCAVPLQVIEGLFISQPVTITIHSGGGQCTDPPSAGYGQITWEKTITTTVQNAVSESDTMTLSLASSPGNQIPPPPSFQESNGYGGSETLFGPACPVPGYRSLDAGAVTIQAPSLATTTVSTVQQQQATVTFYQPPPAPAVPPQQEAIAGISLYQSSLPAGTIEPGKFTLTAAGGADVAAFQSVTQIGSDIQITTPLAGTTFMSPICEPFTLNWTGGDPDSWVTVSVIQQTPWADSFDPGYYYQARASDHSLTWTMNPGPLGGVICNPLFAPIVPVQIVVEVDPDPTQLATFWSPKGLSLNGQVWWRYVHKFDAYFQ